MGLVEAVKSIRSKHLHIMCELYQVSIPIQEEFYYTLIVTKYKKTFSKPKNRFLKSTMQYIAPLSYPFQEHCINCIGKFQSLIIKTNTLFCHSTNIID